MPIEGLPGGDFRGCVTEMRGEVDNPAAFCAWKTHELTGDWPSEEALAVPAATESLHEGLTLTLSEAVMDDAGKLSGIVIAEGLSGNGRNHYTAEALATIADIFADAPIFINHSTDNESRDRPEGNLVNLVGRLSGTAGDFVIEDVEGGAKICRFKNAIITSEPPYIQERIKRGIWRDMSISASGEGAEQDDGTFRVTRFVKHPYTSLDLVTVGAAGGRAEFNESIGGVMSKEDMIKKLEAELAALRGDDIDSALAESKIPAEFRPDVRKLVESIISAVNTETEEATEDDEQPETEALIEGVPPEADGLPEEAQQLWLSTYNASQEAGDEPLTRVNQAWRAVVDYVLGMEAEEESGIETEEIAKAAAEAFKTLLSRIDGEKQGLGTGQPELQAAAGATRLAEALDGWGVENPEQLAGRM